MYYTPSTAAAMDLQNNEIGIQIALEIQGYTNEEIKDIFIEVYGEDKYLKMQEQFPNHTDKQIYFIKRAEEEIENGKAAIIWDYPLH